MIYLQIMGNCGNQFFQYAFARMLQEKYGGELIIDYDWVRNDPYAWEGSDDLLSQFNSAPFMYVINDPSKPHKLIMKIVWKIIYIFRLKTFTVEKYRFYLLCAKFLERFGIYFFDASYYPYRFPRQKDIYINGYFESAKYFADVDEKIKTELTPKNAVLEQNIELLELIERKTSVCITIKRMDVDNSEIASVYDYNINYFYNAVEYIRNRIDDPIWVVFSDNIDWCKQNFQIEGNVYYEKEGNPIWEKVRLMSSCKHFIIHNSSFSWWVQHLSRNKDKIVIAPTKWMNRDDEPIDIYEDYFIYMDNDGNVYDEHF